MKETKKYFDYPLPLKTIRYFNEIYSEVHNSVRGLLRNKRISKSRLQHMEETYSFRLKKGDRLIDLIETDVFYNFTESLDIHVPEALTGELSTHKDPNLTRKPTLYHYFLHRAQRTEFLFLHEMIVGYLGNRLLKKGFIPQRGELLVFTEDYWTLPAYVVRALARTLKISEAELVSYHFAENDEVKNKLEGFFSDLLLTSAHIYSYLDRYAKNSKVPRLPVLLLSLITAFYFIPALEKYDQGVRMRLKKGAGQYIDRKFQLEIFKNSYRPNDIDITRILLELQNEVWIVTKVSERD